MRLKPLFSPLLNWAAKRVKKSQRLFDFVTDHHFYKKSSIVDRLHIFDERLRNVKGIFYQLDLKDDVQRMIFYNLCDRRELDFVLSLIRPGGVYFDVGANVGIYSLKIAQKIGGKGTVHAFEASPRIYERLKYNCELNSFASNLFPHHVAVCEEEKRVTFCEGPAHASGWGSISDYGEDKRLPGKVEVRGISIDRFMKEHEIEKVDFMKIDVEGHEFDVLQGAHVALKNRAIRTILIEFNSELMALKNKSLADFLETFYSYGYTLSPFNQNKAKKILSNHLEQDHCVVNFCFQIPL